MVYSSPAPAKSELPAEIKVNLARGQANITIPSIPIGKMANVTIERVEDLAIREITIGVVNPANNVKIEIKKLPKLPAEVTIEVVGKVYHYISIEKRNVENKDIANVTINFEVSKKWVRENNINESTIALEKWNVSKWIKLPTIKIGEDGEYIYFKAISKELSVFAITGELVLPPPLPTCPTCSQPTDWSACIEGKQKRTNYRCGVETNYTCVAYEETKACVIPQKPKAWYEIIFQAVINFFKKIIDWISRL